MKRWTLLSALVLLAITPLPCSAAAAFCPIFAAPTLTGSHREASFVAYGYFTNPKPDPKKPLETGTTDFVIEKVLKNHDFINGKPVVTLPRLMPNNKDKKFLVFCEVNQGKVDPFRGEEVLPGGVLLDYFTSLLNHKNEPAPKRLLFYFDYLNSTDDVAATDARLEFIRADYADLQAAAKQLPAQAIAGWLSDPNTSTYRYGLYALLLGHCGQAKTHGDMLRAMLDDPQMRESASREAIMTGYLMLQPQEGWAFLQETLKNDQLGAFSERYTALLTLRFFRDNRADVLSKQQIVQGLILAMAAPDVADFAIDDLRDLKHWDLTDQVLGYYGKPSHDSPIIDRAILRFALCSKTPRAVEFVAGQRKRDPVWVSYQEELLQEQMAVVNAAPKK